MPIAGKVRSMLNTIHIRTFLAVIEAGTYTAAAEYLHMSQPAVSMHIRALEEQLGDIRLFRRVGQRMVPTHAGEELLSSARELINLSERTEQNIRALRGQITGRVIIGCTPSSGEHLLPPILSVFSLQYPEVALEIRVASSTMLLDLLAAQEVSLLFLEEQQRRRGWEATFLGDEPLTLLSPSDYPLLQHEQVTPGMLRDYPLILPTTGSPLRQTIEDGLRKRGVHPTDLSVAIETDSVAMMLQGVHHAMGLAFVPISRIPDGCPLDRVALTGEPIQQEWYVLRTRERNAPRAVQEAYTFLTSPTALGLLAKHGLHQRNET